MLKRPWLLLLFVPFLGCNGDAIHSGDRVLVAKCLYESGVMPPRRFDVVVFKYPAGPMKSNVPTNYIKRLLGLPGEIIAIFFGQLFHMTPPPGDAIPGLPQVENELDLWRGSNQPHNREFQDKIDGWFAERKFEIVRKPPNVMLAMRRIVNDNNFQPSDLPANWARWQPRKDSRWTSAGDRRSFTLSSADADPAIDWLTYQHFVRPSDGPFVGNLQPRPRLITDSMGYNDFNLHDPDKRRNLAVNWVGDLMLEATVVTTSDSGQFAMELNRGTDRFRATWSLDSGECQLTRHGESGGEPVVLGSAPTSLRGKGSRVVRFANFDSRLTVWVDRELPFGDGVAYDPPEIGNKDNANVPFEDLRKNWGPREGDLKHPAQLGGRGAGIEIKDLRLWRDTYYTMNVRHADLYGAEALTPEVLSDPSEWERFRQMNPAGFYVYPNHYMCLGDNSTHSSDSREWGMVPRRLMLGRALTIYFPLQRAGLIR